jgi:hypothetical protein
VTTWEGRLSRLEALAVATLAWQEAQWLKRALLAREKMLDIMREIAEERLVRERHPKLEQKP